jgi:hypothetical protein
LAAEQLRSNRLYIVGQMLQGDESALSLQTAPVVPGQQLGACTHGVLMVDS